MQPYVIRQGDYLVKLANALGFDADTAWNDDRNADLRRQRPDPNLLLPGDLLYIPDGDPTAAKPTDLATGRTNAFLSSAPTVSLSLRFADPKLASQPCTIRELDSLTGLTTDDSGLLSVAVPVTVEVVTVVFASCGLECACQVGHLDPADTLSGVFQRLQNLGYIPVDVAFDPQDLDTVRGGLRALKWVAGGADALVSTSRVDLVPASDGDDGPTSGPSTGNADGDSTSSEDQPPSAGDAAAMAGDAPPGPWRPDGLGDDGTLDEITAKLLLDTHGC